MTQHVADGLAVISLGPFISVINHVHSAHGVPNPHENRAVRQVRDGLRRAYGVAPHRCPDRHKDLSVLFDRYIRPVDALEFSSSKDLGL
ncbi:MAG TPA: hypothetical protein VFG72_09950 [Marmoricola sp.]|nr:hypothetical protein [Marmoricola sp.]